MSFGWGGGGARQAEDEWNAYLKKLQQQKQQQQNYQGTGTITPTYNQPYQPAQPTYNQPYQPAPEPAYNGPYQPAATSPPVTTPAATPPKPKTPSTGGKPDNEITPDMVVEKGRYFSDTPGTGIGELAGDPKAAARKWARYYGQGGNAFGNYMSNVIADPMAILKGMGVNAGSLAEPQDQLKWQQRLWDIASGRHKVDGGYGYMSGRGVVQNVLNAKMDNTAGSLGQMLADPSADPQTQVSNTVNLLMGSLQSIISPDALKAYQSTLGRLADEFLDMKRTNPKQWGKLPFNQFLRQKLGSGGGIY